MPTKIICLANSKKCGGRCVAGIKLEETDTKFEIVQNGSNPKWIRPVSNTGYGEVPTAIAQNINLLDVIKFNSAGECPDGYQSENVYFTNNTVEKISTIGSTSKNLRQLTSNYPDLFGNQGKAVSEDVIDYVDHSIFLIRAKKFTVFIKPETNKLRIKFNYNGTVCDLPVTDIKFDQAYRLNNHIMDNIRHLYLTISLGVEHNGWHTKLIAGVIYF